MLNSGLAINELILGQRVPEIMLIDQTSDKPFMERTYVPCPTCGTNHDGRTWSTQNNTAFKNWFGLYCPNCGGIIPCIRNWTSALILFLTYPLWFWWINSWKQSWLAAQPARYANLSFHTVERKNTHWLKMGLLWAAFMFIVMTVVMSVIDESSYSLENMLIRIPIWLVAGLIFGFVMKWMMSKKARNTD